MNQLVRNSVHRVVLRQVPNMCCAWRYETQHTRQQHKHVSKLSLTQVHRPLSPEEHFTTFSLTGQSNVVGNDLLVLPILPVPHKQTGITRQHQ